MPLTIMTRNMKYEIRNTKYKRTIHDTRYPTSSTTSSGLRGASTIRDTGFTLIEILIFTAIVSVFFVVAAAVTAYSLNIMRTNENRLYATHYADEASEWLRNERDTTDWSAFSGSSPGNYCMNSDILGWVAGPCPTTGGTSYALGSTYKRQFNRDVVLTSLEGGSISSSVTVSWKDVNGNTLYVPINTIFAQTE